MLEDAEPKWQIKTFQRGDRINTNPDILYLIKSGAVKINTYDISGKIYVLGYWGKGDVVGQSLSEINPYRIECLTPTKVSCIPYQDWHYVVSEIRNCHQDNEKMLYVLGQDSVGKKLLELLIHLSNKFGSTQANGKAILLNLSHRELAEFIGSTRVSVTKSMNRLQSQNIVEYSKRGSIILRISQDKELNSKI